VRRIGVLLWPLFILVVVSLLQAGCDRRQIHQQESYVFGTRVEVLIQGVPADQARAAAAEVLREFDRLHAMLHAWQPSELTKLNDAIAAGARDVEVSPELAAILADAQTLAARSDHLFNPALGRLIGLWGFQSDEFKPVVPAAAEIATLVTAAPSMADLDIGTHRVTSRKSSVRLDLGGYAKGYALDRAAALLRARGIRNALVNIGGNVMALGNRGDRPWRVGIQHPRGPEPLAMLELHDGEAIGTSGDYQRYFELDGRRYCHILDPRSGRPAAGTQAVTVLVGSREGAGTLSDVASKPPFISGAAGWRESARRLGIDHALRIDASGSISVTRTLHERLSFAHAAPHVELIE
jgi:thiamine biosynthesis lipoprotein